MLRLTDEMERVIAMLHDVVEDAPLFGPKICGRFPREVALAVLDLTRRHREPYDAYIGRICAASDSIKRVKLADLEDNMDGSRITNPTESDRKRTEKYRLARQRIVESMVATAPAPPAAPEEC
jgi:(p)ppGpp synthase/HD superfamily hydrolase